MAGHATLRSATLADLVRPGTVRPASEPDSFGSDRLLPVLPELSELLPGRGLRRGSTVAVVASPPLEPGGRVPPGGRTESGSGAPSDGRAWASGRTEADGETPSGGRVPSGGHTGRGDRTESDGRALSGGGAESDGRALSGDGAVSGSGAELDGRAALGDRAALDGRAASGGRALSGGGVSAVSAVPADSAAGAGDAVASGSASLVLALIAAASRAGSWCALVGVPTFGALAAADMGIALDRLALVPNPGPDWPTVVAALIDGVDVVVIAAPGVASASIASRLAARARQRGTVLVPYGRWDGADVTLRVVRGEWEGLGQGSGRLRRRQVVIAARGRGAASRPKEITVWMPGNDGRAIAAVAEPAPRRRTTLTRIRAAS